MLQRMFYIEIALLQNIGPWKYAIILGLVTGVVMRLMGVRRQKDFGDSMVAVLLMWVLIHTTNIVVYPSGTIYTPTLALSVVATLCPVTTFMVIGFVITHLVVKLKGEG